MPAQSRRHFFRSSLVLGGLALLSGCTRLLPAAEPAEKVPRIGFLSAVSANERTEAFRDGLRELGYEESQTIVFDYRFADGAPARLPSLAAELAAVRPELTVSATTPAAQAARQAAPEVPIVLAGGDAVGAGLIANIAQPEGNITGLTTSNVQLTAKRLELLNAAVASVSRVAFLVDPIVNLKTAEALGLSVPQLLLQQATEIIQ